MHVLHRPDLRKALAITAIAAVSAMVLTLAIAGRLSDIAYAPAPASQPGTAAGLQTSLPGPGPSTSPFNRSPFSNLLTAPVTAPWPHNGR